MFSFGCWIAACVLCACFLPAPARSAETPADAATDAVMSAQPDARILVFGELHGTHEAPALLAALATRAALARDVIVALEMPAQDQGSIDAWLASDGSQAARDALLTTAFWRVPPERSDGRRSVAMLALLDALRVQHMQHPSLRVALFDDATYKDPVTRERGMADALRSIHAAAPQSTLLILTGNYHARRKTDGPGNLVGDYAPPGAMASLLHDLDVVTVNIAARGGRFWACRSGSCGIRAIAQRDADDATVR